MVKSHNTCKDISHFECLYKHPYDFTREGSLLVVPSTCCSTGCQPDPKTQQFNENGCSPGNITPGTTSEQTSNYGNKILY